MTVRAALRFHFAFSRVDARGGSQLAIMHTCRAAPELLLRRKCTMAVDSWSFGVLLWVSFTSQF